MKTLTMFIFFFAFYLVLFTVTPLASQQEIKQYQYGEAKDNLLNNELLNSSLLEHPNNIETFSKEPFSSDRDQKRAILQTIPERVRKNLARDWNFSRIENSSSISNKQELVGLETVKPSADKEGSAIQMLSSDSVVVEWVATYSSGSTSYNYATALAVDASGNVYVTGYSEGSGSGYDYATVKYNTNGVEQWVARYNGPGNQDDEATAIAVDASGNVYVTGYSYGSGTGDDYATIKYNTNGVEQWIARYNGPSNSYDKASAIAVDASGNIYVTGYSFYQESLRNYATVKYDSEGIFKWAAIYNGSSNSDDEATAIAVDASGNVYVTGWSIDSVSGIDYATLKYNTTSGSVQWIARYNGPSNGDDLATAIAVDASGSVYVTGYSEGSGTGPDYATVKYSPLSGSVQWIARYDGPIHSFDEATAIAIDSSGNVYVTGWSEDLISGIDYATLKYNPSSGSVLWVARYNGTGNGYDIASDIAVDASGNVYVTGKSEGSSTGYDYATIMYNSYGIKQWVARYNGPGNGNDDVIGIGLDNFGNIYVSGTAKFAFWMRYATIKYKQIISDVEDEPI